MILKNLEKVIEHGLFASRWIMAPFYIGLAGSLFLLLYGFILELFAICMAFPSLTPTDIILGILTLIDLSLAGNLVLIVIVSGYENFISKMEVNERDADKFEWRGEVDFSTLKLKLIASIVAISGIHLLQVFMNIANYSEKDLYWMAVLQVIFVLSGILMGVMDYVAVRTKALKKPRN
ncbi:MAG: TIGR00645 family protein [Rickettsiales bacterium]